MLNKTQARKEKEIIVQMSEKFKSLSNTGKNELVKLKCRNELLTFCVVMSRKLKGDKFTPYDVHSLVCEYTQMCADGWEDYDHITISLPPRTGKSTIISQYLPAWQMGRNPKARFIMGSHTLSLVERNSSRVIEIMAHPEYSRIFPKTKLVSKGLKINKFETTMKGGLLCATPKVKISGFDAGTIEANDFPGLIILDDLLASGNSVAELETAWNWTKDQLITRTLPNIGFISMGTRYHSNDVTGRLIEASPELWKNMSVPAICVDEANDPLDRKVGESFWEEKYPMKSLLIKKSIMQEEFDTIYQGQPQGSKGNLILEDDLITIPEIIQGSVFMSVDTNFKKSESGDYNAVCIWSRAPDANFIQLIDVLYTKSDFHALLMLLGRLIEFYKPRQITIEAKANGDSLTSMLETQFPGITIYPFNPMRDKVARFSLAAPSVKTGKVVVYNGIKDWDTYEKQLLQFPYVQHDDFCDAFSLGIIFWRDIICSGEFDSSGSLGYGMFVPEIKEPVDTSILKVGLKKHEAHWDNSVSYF